MAAVRTPAEPAGAAPAAAETGTGRAGMPQLLPYALLTLTVLFWAGNFIVGRAVRYDVAPVSLAFWRWVVALALLLPVAGPDLWRCRMVVVRHWRLLALLGLTGITGFHLCVYIALQSTQAVNAALYLATTPLAIVVVAWAMFGDRIAARAGIGIAASMAGAAVVVTRGDPAVVLHLQFNIGDLWMLLAVPLWALYSVLLKHRPATLPPLALLTATMAFGLMPLTLLYLWRAGQGEAMAWTVDSAAAVAYVAVCASVIAYICWNHGVREVGPTRAGVFINLIPVFAAVLAVVFLDERIAGYHLVGAALVFGGLLLVSRGRR